MAWISDGRGKKHNIVWMPKGWKVYHVAVPDDFQGQGVVIYIQKVNE